MVKRRLWMVFFGTGDPNMSWMERMMGCTLNILRTNTMNGWSAIKVGKRELMIRQPQAIMVTNFHCSEAEVNTLWSEVVQNSSVN